MRHFQMHVLHKTDFQLLVYQCFRWASTTRGRHSHEAHQAPQTPFHQARVGKTANSLLKNSAKIHLKNERKIIRPTGLKVAEKSTENIQSKFPQKSTKNHCKRLIYLVFGAVPLNYFLLQFHTVPQISRMRAKRAPRSPLTSYSIFINFFNLLFPGG